MDPTLDNNTAQLKTNYELARKVSNLEEQLQMAYTYISQLETQLQEFGMMVKPFQDKMIQNITNLTNCMQDFIVQTSTANVITSNGKLGNPVPVTRDGTYLRVPLTDGHHSLGLSTIIEESRQSYSPHVFSDVRIVLEKLDLSKYKMGNTFENDVKTEMVTNISFSPKSISTPIIQKIDKEYVTIRKTSRRKDDSSNKTNNIQQIKFSSSPHFEKEGPKILPKRKARPMNLQEKPLNKKLRKP